MNLAVGLPLLVLSVMLEGSVLPHLRVQGGQPDLVLLVVISWSLLSKNVEGLAWAFAGGLLLDLFSGAPLGVSSVGLVVAAYVAGLGRGQVTYRNVVLPPLMALVGTAIFHMTSLLLLVALGLHPPTWADSLRYVTLPSAVFNLLLVFPIFWPLGVLYARLYRRQRSVSA